MRRRRRLAAVGVGLASSALILLGAELLARWLLPGASRADTLASYTESDPLLGWRKRPGARATYDHPEYKVEVAINSRGLRDLEHAEVPPPGVCRILCLGDSFVEGYTVPLEQTVSRVLESTLQASGKRSEVLNGGTTGYSTDQEYLFYTSEGVRYAPRILVLFFFFNDVVFNERETYYPRPKPLLDVGPGGLRPVNAPVPALQNDQHKAFGGSALLGWLRGRALANAPRAHQALARLGFWPPAGPDAYQVFSGRDVERVEGAWRQTTGILSGLKQSAAEHGARLLVVYVPSRIEVSDATWAATLRARGSDAASWDRGLVRDRLATALAELDLPLLDLTDPLRRAESLPGGSYFSRDPHWNSRGHRVAARETAAFLLRESWIR